MSLVNVSNGTRIWCSRMMRCRVSRLGASRSSWRWPRRRSATARWVMGMSLRRSRIHNASQEQNAPRDVIANQEQEGVVRDEHGLHAGRAHRDAGGGCRLRALLVHLDERLMDRG